MHTKNREMKAQIYYYIIVDSKNRPLLESGRLPIFWLRKVAKDVVKNFPNHFVKRMKHEELIKIIE